MKKSALVLGLLALVPVLGHAAEACGYISQEAEGTWLEVPYANDDSRIETIYTLVGAGVELLEWGTPICVTYTEVLDEEPLTVKVDSYTSWIQ